MSCHILKKFDKFSRTISHLGRNNGAIPQAPGVGDGVNP